MRLQYPPLQVSSTDTNRPSQAQPAVRTETLMRADTETRTPLIDHDTRHDFEIEPWAMVERIIACMPNELEELARREAVDGWALIHTEVDARTPGGILASFGRSRRAAEGRDDRSEMAPPAVESVAAVSVGTTLGVGQAAAERSGGYLRWIEPEGFDIAPLQPTIDFLVHSAELLAFFAVIALAGRVMGPGLLGRVFPILVFLRFWDWGHGQRSRPVRGTRM